MKKAFSLLLAAVMLFALVVPTFAASNDADTVYADPVVMPDPTRSLRAASVAGFVDVSADDWFAPAVQYVKDAGLMNGVGDNRFDPYGAVTRAMVVTVLYRMLEQPDVKGKTCPFNDVPVGEWYFNAVIWAADAGVTSGVDSTHFAPTQPITREQMATMIMRMLLTFADDGSREKLAQIEKIDPTGAVRRQMLAETFTDAADVSDYARTYVLLCKLGEIMNGDAAGTFRPQATLNRAECAQTFLNLSKLADSLIVQ